MMSIRFTAALVLLVAMALADATTTLAAPLIAPGAALPPRQQQTKFHLPPGFQIQLVASEPDIGQPMNLSFDARGRLWVTHSVEYPFPAKTDGVEPRSRFPGVGDHPPRDALSVIESIGPDGHATKITRFVEGLNIPIGQTPIEGGAIVYSIPNIWRCLDTDGDGKADTREPLYGRFGNIDTHGMASSFTPWIDGWIYGTHGFANTSHIKGSDGQQVDLNSGNTYRFRADGSHFEQFTWGQVNPFGLCFDPRGNMYVADCHSMPVYLMLRGAYYPSFGKPDDGLGFGPVMINHNHGSTGIAGVTYYDAEQFPPDYRGNLFIGNPVTGRVHRDKIVWHGSSPQADTQADFITCDDGWFRPVNIQLGPDGALYVADFYNAIIGHYEVPLTHPQRDREKGRIWRVVYVGQDGKAAAPKPMADLTRLRPADLAAQMSVANLAVRVLATNRLVAVADKATLDTLRASLMRSAPQPTGGYMAAQHVRARAHGLWVMFRRGQLDRPLIERLASDDALVQTHLMKALAEVTPWQPYQFNLVRQCLAHDDPFVRRAAAEALGQHPDAGNIAPLLSLWGSTQPDDTHLIHMVRIALRNQLRDASAVGEIGTLKLSGADLNRVADIALAVPTQAAAMFVLQHIRQNNVGAADLGRYLQHVARYIGESGIDGVAAFARQRFTGDPGEQLSLFQAISQGLAQRGVKTTTNDAMRNWAGDLAAALLDADNQRQPPWANHPAPGEAPSAAPWGIRHRGSTDGDTTAMFFDSIANGEKLTGLLRSRPFTLPDTFSFWMCGHNGFPNTNPPPKNHIRLMLAATGAEITRAIPPRNDTARRYTWDLHKYKGQQGYIEIIDADTDNAYAWIGVGRFDPPLVRVPPVPPGDEANQQVAAIELVGQFKLNNLAARVSAMVGDHDRSGAVRAAAAQAALAFNAAVVPVLTEAVQDAAEPDALRLKAAELLGRLDRDAVRKALVAAFKSAPAPMQRSLALSLASSPRGAATLLDAVAAGQASAQLLQDKAVVERLGGASLANLDQRIAALTKGLPEPDQRIAALIGARAAGFAAADASPQRGMAVFTKSCAACHRIGDQGAMIGPQLDGVGIRGVQRILEDVLDPNRNVDQSLRLTIITTKDGDTIAGLVRRMEGKVLVLADSQGKEVKVAAGDIDTKRVAALSPMPANFADLIPEKDLYDLLAYLLAQKQGEGR